jgi:acetyl esterase/lipase
VASQRPLLDPELAEALRIARPDGPASVTTELIETLRHALATAAISDEELAAGGDVLVQHHTAIAADGSAVPLLVIRPRAPAGGRGAPCVYYLHGGGMIMGDNRTGIQVPLSWALELGTTIVSAQYRLAPEHPDPVPVEDCYAGRLWLHEHAAEIGVDRSRVVVAGSSAGGGLAAGVTLLARDRGGPASIGQLLMSPMLDDRAHREPGDDGAVDEVWDRVSNSTGWDALLGSRRGGPDVTPYSSPSRATDLTSLPPAFLDAGSAELFRSEVVDYAARLWRAGTQAELHVWPGAFHAFDTIVPQAALSVVCAQSRAAWLRRLLSAG